MSLPVAPRRFTAISQKCAKRLCFRAYDIGLEHCFFGVHVCVQPRMTSRFILKGISLILEEMGLLEEEEEEGNSRTVLHQHNRNLEMAVG